MTKNTPVAIMLAIILTLALSAGIGCGGNGDDDNGDTAPTETATTADGDNGDDGADNGDTGGGTGGSEDFDEFLADLEDLEATITIIKDGETDVIWSQKQGSWRWEDPADETSYVIYNDTEGKMWTVSGDTAQELPGVDVGGQAWWGQSPAAVIAAFALFPGTQSGDTWTMNVPGGGSLTIKLDGPEGLPTKVVIEEPDADDEVLEFEYTDVGNVSDDLFILPASVTVQAMPDIEGIDNIDLLIE